MKAQKCDIRTCMYICMMHAYIIHMYVQYMQIHMCISALFFVFLAIVCEEDSCGDNEVCKNTPTGFVCQCDIGYERDEDVCSKLSRVGSTCINSWQHA